MASLSPALAREALIQQIQQLFTSDPYHEFSLIVEDNSKLRQQEKYLNITNDQNLKALARLQQNIDTVTERNAEYSTQLDHLTQENQQLQRSLDGAEGTIMKKDKELDQNDKAATKLEAMLKRRETEIDNFKQCLHRERETLKVAEDARNSVEHDLTLFKRELSSHKERLQWLSQFSAELRKPDRDLIRQQLHDMFKLVHNLAVSFFGHDFEKSAFQDPAHWEQLRNHDILKRIVPLPLSNTTAAKDMRVAAVLGICAEALSRHLFRSTYLLDGNQLHELIDFLQDQDWHKGIYLRSVLLRSRPDMQEENSIKRAKTLVAEVLELTKPILSDEKQLLFGDSLLKICKNIAEQWMRLQGLEAAVEPEFGLNEDADDWTPFPLWHNTTRAANGNDECSLDQDPKKPAPSKADSKLNITHSNFVVWPAFFISKEGEVELLQQGFALSEEQMKSAKDEESAIASRRARQAARNTTRRRNKLPASSLNGVLDLKR